MNKNLFLTFLFLLVVCAPQMVAIELSTIFSTVAAVADNVTNTTDSWHVWCGKMSDGSCIAVTIFSALSMGCACVTGSLVVGACVFAGVGLGTTLFPFLIPAAQAVASLPTVMVGGGCEAVVKCSDDIREQRKMKKELKEKEIRLQIKKDEEDFDRRKKTLPTIAENYFFKNLSEVNQNKNNKNNKKDIKIFFA